MSKKVMAMIMAAMISLSLAGCGSNNDNNTNSSTKDTVIEEEYENTTGKWSRDFTFKDFTDTAENLATRIKKQTKEYGLEYTEDEVVKDDNNKTISVENKEAEKNKLEGMYFSRILYGENLSAGKIKMKILLNFDGEKAIKDNDFDLGSTSVAKYSAIITGANARNYRRINTKILDILNSDSGEGYFKNEIEGLTEEITVTKKYIVYSVETTKYEFKKAEQ